MLLSRDRDRDREAGTVPGCAAQTGMPEEHHCSEESGWTQRDPQGTPCCLQLCWEPQCQDMDIHDLSQLHSPRGGQIPMV